MFRLPFAAVINVPPSRKTSEEMMIVSFRPYLSANGKVQSAPKKHPAWWVSAFGVALSSS
jgi:hypothetical protein